MFTGIVQAVGVVCECEGARNRRVSVDCSSWDWSVVAVGDSVAVQGVCLTVTARRPEGFQADVSEVTLSCTTLGRLVPGARVNLEPALRLKDRLGGHLVSGHVDAVGRLRSRNSAGESLRFEFTYPEGLRRYLAIKGSVTVDGVSLTINERTVDTFTVNLVPHTLEATTLATLAPGDPVNLEVDLIARYLETLLSDQDQKTRGVTREFLEEHGFPAGIRGPNRV
ncbi:MAG: riboflavin synthase [Acidiferrobacteraceae bacterium]